MNNKLPTIFSSVPFHRISWVAWLSWETIKPRRASQALKSFRPWLSIQALSAGIAFRPCRACHSFSAHQT